MKRYIAQSLIVFVALVVSGCASFYQPKNPALPSIDQKKGYRGLAHLGRLGDMSVYLSFSGGGTRAAALSYGVLQELAATQIGLPDNRRRLLDEVDHISSVSGGSFTAAYYGLFGDKIFESYEKDFLRVSIQGTLISKLFSPGYWYKSMFSGFDRTELAINYYDEAVFKGKTFADMRPYPFITINATDISQGSRFAFSQEYFDLICSDLDKVEVARAVTASSAVPVLFPPVVLKNHAGVCDISQSRLWPLLSTKKEVTSRERKLLDDMGSYQLRDERPYIHLVDGGISDNLGLRAMLERLQLTGLQEMEFARVPSHVVIIFVDAEVKPKRPMDQSAEKPSIGTIVDAVTSAQISRYTAETQALMQEAVATLQSQAKELNHPTQFHLIEVKFAAEKQERLSDYLNSLPTSLELSNEEIDVLIATGRSLLRQSPDYQQFLKAGNVKGVQTTKVRGATSGCADLDPLTCLLQKAHLKKGDE